MRKKFIVLLILLSCQCWASVTGFILVQPDAVPELMARLDTITANEPNTEHYTQPINSWMATVTTILIPIDERAQAVLTPEEWASRLATPPVEFVPPMP
jgi:hypothetical protein